MHRSVYFMGNNDIYNSCVSSMYVGGFWCVSVVKCKTSINSTSQGVLICTLNVYLCGFCVYYHIIKGRHVPCLVK